MQHSEEDTRVNVTSQPVASLAEALHLQWSNCTTQCTKVNGSFPSCSFELLCSAASLAAVPAVARALQCIAVKSTRCVPYGSFPYCSFAFIYCTTATAPLSAPDSTVASLAAVSLPAVLCFEASPAAVPAVATALHKSNCTTQCTTATAPLSRCSFPCSSFAVLLPLLQCQQLLQLCSVAPKQLYHSQCGKIL